MKVAPAAVAIPLLLVLVLLTWFSVRALDSDAELYDQALAALDQFTTVENALNRDVLSARAGLLRNYDALVQEEKALRDLLERLRETVAMNTEGTATVDRLAFSTGRQEELVEQFKSNNALLQNSLAYLGRFSGRISSSNEDALLSPAVRALVSATLHLTLDTSPEARHDLENRLRELGAQLDQSGEPERIEVLLAHVQLLWDLLPATDNLLKTLLAAPSADEQMAVRSLVLARQHASRETARRYRLLLYAASLFLLGVLIHLGLRLRRRTLALRHRAEFEHVIASISMRFIDAQAHEIAARVEEALAHLAGFLGAERAYFLLPGTSTSRHTWCRDGTTFPPGWPDRAAALASRLNQSDGVIHVPRVRHLPLGAERDALAAAGLESWICITALGEDAPSLLGFDILCRGSIHTSSCEISLLRMARDAVTNAVGRDLLEQERRRLKTRLEQARRLETVGALASGIAHNFNNLIGAILGYAEMAETELSARRPPVRNLGEIRRVGERASTLVDQIMAFGRHRDPTLRPVSMNTLVAETVSLLEALLPPACSLVLRGTADAAVVSGSAAQLQQVIVNLCSNAAQAMGNTGRIELATRLCEIGEPRQLTQGELEAGRYVCIAVTDRGGGMDEATASRIFEPFFTTRSDGNGLGLATVREIVRDHGGAIDVESRLGAGSRFTVWLPCSAAMDEAAAPNTPSLPLGAGETLMVVDEDHKQLLRHEEMLAALGYEPVGFANAAAALAACRANPVRFDAMLVCHLTPPAGAMELVAAIRQIVPSLPILRAMASLDSLCADGLLAAGISEIVHMPLASGEIAEALARCLEVARRRSPLPA